jgi:hypothetical protein
MSTSWKLVELVYHFDLCVYDYMFEKRRTNIFLFYLSIPHSKSIIKRLNRPPPVFVGIETYWSSSQCREDIQDEILRERERDGKGSLL